MGRFVRVAPCRRRSDLTIFIGIFELVASLMIFVMGITMLKMDRGNYLCIVVAN